MGFWENRETTVRKEGDLRLSCHGALWGAWHIVCCRRRQECGGWS
jgi:hypothetical protein